MRLAEGETVGWLVEMLISNEPWWWALGLPDEENWTKDSVLALRFARKEDAEAFITDMGWTEVIATEHAWLNPTSPKGVQSWKI